MRGDLARLRGLWTLHFTSGLINPGFRNKITALQVNPFVFEVFGVVERGEGKANTEATGRTWHRYATDVVYRVLPREQAHAAVRYNTAEGMLVGIPTDAGANRWQLAGG